MRARVLTLLLLVTAACAPSGQAPDGTVALVPVNAVGYPVQAAAAAPQRTAPVAAPMAARPASAAAPARSAGTAVTVAATPGSGPPPIADDAIYNPKSLTPLQIVTADPSKYEVVKPRAVPARPREADANIVAYALESSNRVGQPVYVRAADGADGLPAVCGRFASDDKAQEAFLEAGGPTADPHGLDPDGDGFACAWDPAPFRRAVQ